MSLTEKLRTVLEPEQILCNELMSQHTTFRTGGPAEYYLTPRQKQLPGLMALLRREEIPVTVIGNGSNLLVSDRGIAGVVIELGREMAQITLTGGEIRAEAGALLAAVSAKAAAAGLAGMEFASGIPGSVGGAVVMNAGAYGGEIRDILRTATVLTPEGDVKELLTCELDLSYRHSIIPEAGYLVLEACFALPEGDPEAIRARINELKEQRVSKQPLEYPSAGSTFKRPEGYFAGKLIQDSGLKGYTIGGAQVSEKHSGFLINIGGATSDDVYRLIKYVQERVYADSGVMLEPEVRMIGTFE